MITLKNPNNGQIVKAPTGFSWTTLFFGVLVPLIRGDFKWTLISLLLSLLTAGLFWLIFPFIYNGIYIKDLLKNGYVPADEKSKEYLIRKSLISDSEVKIKEIN